MDHPSEPNVAFDLSRLESVPAAFVVELNATPRPAHPLRHQLRAPLLRPGPEGLRDEGKAQAHEATARFTAAGFDVDEPTTHDDGLVAMEIHREDALSDGQADALVAEVLDLLLPLDGEYDGWGCPVVKA